MAQDRKEYMKEYKKKYNEKNKEKIKEKKKEYQEKNKEKKKEYDRQRYLKNKEAQNKIEEVSEIIIEESKEIVIDEVIEEENNIKVKTDRKEYLKKWREKNKDYQKEYYQKNKDIIKNNKDVINEKRRIYYFNNKEKYQKNSKKWLEKNKEKRKEQNKIWWENNKDYQKEYRNKNKERSNNLQKEKRINDPLFRLKGNIRSLIRQSIKNKGYIKESRTHDILGCSYEDFKIHLEKQFEDWMNWNNYGNPEDGIYELNKTWDIDHIIPLATATNEEELLKLNHYTNLQPLCSYTNRFVKKDIC